MSFIEDEGIDMMDYGYETPMPQNEIDGLYFESDSLPEFRQSLADHLLGLPSLQNKPGIQKGSPEWYRGDTCSDCGYTYFAELAGCICSVYADKIYEIRQEIAEAFGVETPKE